MLLFLVFQPTDEHKRPLRMEPKLNQKSLPIVLNEVEKLTRQHEALQSSDVDMMYSATVESYCFYYFFLTPKYSKHV